MKRRALLKSALHLGLIAHPVSRLVGNSFTQQKERPITTGLRKPVTIYNNWSAYDELSDNIPLTEALAMKELGEIIRMKKSGVQFNCYVMDAFWFDKSGGYRVWHKERWPNGPDKWLNTCKENGIKPGMWFSTNNLIDSDNGTFLDVIPEWKDSLASHNSLCLFRGGYLKHLSDTLQMWADKGVQVFKFDFADFGAATPDAEKLYLRAEIEERNKLAFIDALKQLRLNNPDLLLIGYNGFGGEFRNTYAPFRKSVDHRWLEVFDTMYCGDPRFSDVPAMNIWRSQDIFSDHMVRQYENNGLPLNRIDNCGFMIGVAGTCYSRATNAWKGMQILEMARGGWLNVFHGNMELLTEKDAQWFARTQNMFLELQQYGITSTFGELPGKRKPYGFMATTLKGTVCTVVNPSQAITEIKLPAPSFVKTAVIYTDGGFKPIIKGNMLTLGAEQLVVVAFEEYAIEKYDLGVDDTIKIPYSINAIPVDFKSTVPNSVEGTITPVKGKDIRILFQQIGEDNFPKRSSGGAPPNGKKMDTILKINVTQNGKDIPLNIAYDKAIWSGLSWAAVEVKSTSFNPSFPLQVTCTTTESGIMNLQAEVYAVSYNQ